MDILPSSPTPEASLAIFLHNQVDDPALFATRAVSLVRQVSRLQARSQAGKATSRRDSLYGVRLHQAQQLLVVFGLTVIIQSNGVGIGTIKSAQSPSPTWLWGVSP